MHILQRIYYAFKHDGQIGTFGSFTVTAAPEPAGPATFRDTIDHLAHVIESAVFEGSRLATPEGHVCAVGSLVKKPLYEESSSEIRGGFQYEGRYSLSSDATAAERPLHRATKSGDYTGSYDLHLCGAVHRWSSGSVDTEVTLTMHAGHILNLALLDRILADPDFLIAPPAQEALARIAALRAGQRSADPNEWVALLRPSDSSVSR